MRLRFITSTLLAAILTVIIPVSVLAGGATSTPTFAPTPTPTSSPSLSTSSTSPYSNYVALGDSVASGAGLGGDLNRICDRSSLAYPSLLADKLGTTVQNLACSGAKVDEGIYGTQARAGFGIRPQLDRAFENGTPDLITMTIGANDVRWASFVRKCYLFECGSNLDKAQAVLYRADLRYELYRALQSIETLSRGNPPTVIVNGYYNPIPKGKCAATAEISATETAWLAEQKNFLNRSLRSVVSHFDFAEYVHTNFGGHKLCTVEPWLQGEDDRAPLHPNVIGQEQIAETNFRALSR